MVKRSKKMPIGKKGEKVVAYLAENDKISWSQLQLCQTLFGKNYTGFLTTTMKNLVDQGKVLCDRHHYRINPDYQENVIEREVTVTGKDIANLMELFNHLEKGEPDVVYDHHEKKVPITRLDITLPSGRYGEMLGTLERLVCGA